MKLQIWNGNAQTFVPPAIRQAKNLRHNAYVHMYGCAPSRAALVRMIEDWSGHRWSLDSYIRDYWSKGAWGNSMEGITPEVGLWVRWDDRAATKPERVWPPQPDHPEAQDSVLIEGGGTDAQAEAAARGEHDDMIAEYDKTTDAHQGSNR